MKQSKKSMLLLVVLASVITLMTAIASSAQSAINARPVQVPQGQKQKVQGVVSVRYGDSFKSPRAWGQRDYGALNG